MSVYFFNKNPNVLFPGGSSYAKDDVDQLFSGLTTDGVTQSALTFAIEDFISVTEINIIMGDYTVDYISQSSINSKYETATIDFRTSDEIDSSLSGDTSYFLNEDGINVFASANTSQYIEEHEAYDNAYSAAEVSQLYWHPAPFYKRTLYTNDTEYTLGNTGGDTTTISVSANTDWAVQEIGDQWSSWYSLSAIAGDTSVEITVTAVGSNTGGSRYVDLEFDSVQTNGTPFTVKLTQLSGVVA